MDYTFDAVRLSNGNYISSALVLPLWRSLLRLWKKESAYLIGLSMMVDRNNPTPLEDFGALDFKRAVADEEIVNRDGTIYPVVAEFIREAVRPENVKDETLDLLLQWPVLCPINELTEFTGDWGYNGAEWDGVEEFIFEGRDTRWEQ